MDSDNVSFWLTSIPKAHFPDSKALVMLFFPRARLQNPRGMSAPGLTPWYCGTPPHLQSLGTATMTLLAPPRLNCSPLSATAGTTAGGVSCSLFNFLPSRKLQVVLPARYGRWQIQNQCQCEEEGASCLF